MSRLPHVHVDDLPLVRRGDQPLAHFLSADLEPDSAPPTNYTRRLAGRSVPPHVPPSEIQGQGVERWSIEGEYGWYVLCPDGQPFTDGGQVVVWELFSEAYANRKIRL
jgi:hypothetical protein